ncbi:MAG: hypothetical protein H6819_02600 [Phycisphaerales bacterium]|nr:hypothetical protein [Phycisphaerales bacterium]MCB9856897.1 hypothetical protein [Phycisphaerales bacterium]MCB9861976.1 hypothetical protein [Phycisphaerales bacterium]
MSIVIECISCRTKKKAPDRLAGKRVRCKCGNVIAIPAEAPLATPSELDLSEISLMSHGDAVAAPTSCPSCMAVMQEGAILCVNCGFNKQTGQRVGDAGESGGAIEAAGESPTLTRKKVDAKPPPAWVSSVVKMLVFLVFAGGFGYAAYHIVQAVTFDPTKQREADMLVVSPKMKVNDVVKAIGRPPKEILTERDPSTADNVVKFVPKKLFWSNDFMDKYTEEDLQYGFTFVYKYTEREHLYIWFNSDGEVEYMEKHDPLQLLFGGQ